MRVQPGAEGRPLVDKAWQFVPEGSTSPLRHDEVHVWHSSLWCTIPEFEELFAYLAPDEMERAGSMRFGADRTAWTASRAMLRCLLATYTGAHPRSIRLGAGRWGKPNMTRPATDIEFNASRSQSEALWLVCRAGAVGIDIEKVNPAIAAEVALLLDERDSPPVPAGSSPAGESPRHVFEAWARREAILKARGTGWSDATGDFTWRRPEDEVWVGSDWATATLQAAEGYVAAVCIPAKVKRIRLFRWSPVSAIAAAAAFRGSGREERFQLAAVESLTDCERELDPRLLRPSRP